MIVRYAYKICCKCSLFYIYNLSCA